MKSFFYKKKEMHAYLSMVASGITCLLQPNGVAAVSTNGAMITSQTLISWLQFTMWVTCRGSAAKHLWSIMCKNNRIIHFIIHWFIAEAKVWAMYQQGLDCKTCLTLSHSLNGDSRPPDYCMSFIQPWARSHGRTCTSLFSDFVVEAPKHERIRLIHHGQGTYE